MRKIWCLDSKFLASEILQYKHYSIYLDILVLIFYSIFSFIILIFTSFVLIILPLISVSFKLFNNLIWFLLLVSKTDILHVRLFGNYNITFQNKPLIFSSFLRSNIKTIQDIWDENSKQFIDCEETCLNLRMKHLSICK
jgi:hypothetical protein